MSNDCPKCNSQNRVEATFCDACGASLATANDSAASAPEATSGEQRKPNYAGLIGVPIILLAGWWFLFSPNSSQNAPAPAGSGGASTANPHGGMDSGAAAGAPDDGMNQMMEGIASAKTSLESNPLDTEALMTLYRTFGTIGRQDQIRPYLESAVEALVAQAGEMEPEALTETLSSIAYSAFYGNDPAGAEYAINTVGDAAQNNKDIMVLKGNIYFDLGRVDDSLDAYTAYLLEADPETDGMAYWNARTDRATMLLQAGTERTDELKVQEALNEFKIVTKEMPDFFNAWFNLGLASNAVGDATAAEAAFETCVFLASSEVEGYQVALQLAAIRGEEPPAPPASMAPQGMGGGMGGTPEGGMANPHGGGEMGGGDTSEGMANPHGGGDMGGGDTSEGMANPHGGA